MQNGPKPLDPRAIDGWRLAEEWRTPPPLRLRGEETHSGDLLHCDAKGRATQTGCTRTGQRNRAPHDASKERSLTA